VSYEYGETKKTVLGHTYTVEILRDEYPSEPDRDDVVTIYVQESGEHCGTMAIPCKDFRAEGMPDITGKLIDNVDSHSEYALVRWLVLCGVEGLHILTWDYGVYSGTFSARPFEDYMLESMNARVGGEFRCAGFAFIEPSLAESQLSDGADNHAVVADAVAERNAYLSGDVFGYRITHEDGTETDSCWGYYGIDREGEYVTEEIDAEILVDVADRDIRERVQRIAQEAEEARVASVFLAKEEAERRYNVETLLSFTRWMETVGLTPLQSNMIRNALTESGVRFVRPEMREPRPDVRGGAT
jgi:hypothetical protein